MVDNTLLVFQEAVRVQVDDLRPAPSKQTVKPETQAGQGTV